MSYLSSLYPPGFKYHFYVGASLFLYFLITSLLEEQRREVRFQFVTLSTHHVSADLIFMIII